LAWVGRRAGYATREAPGFRGGPSRVFGDSASGKWPDRRCARRRDRRAALPLTIETYPRENQTPDVETTAYLVENGDQLLIAFDARDPEPESIRAYLRDRDSAFNDDFVGVILDTFNDQRRAFEFFINPLGVQMDLINDQVNNSESSSWDAIWDSAGQINERGFTAEMAIPFSQLRFPRTAGDQTWGIGVLRFRPRAQRVQISNNPQDRNLSCFLCQFDKFTGFANAEPGKALEVVPTLTATRTDSPPLPPATATPGQLERGDFETEAGLGVRWGITPDLTLDLTLNPDFSQVEADVAQLEENTTFALSYPESRPFFLEGEDYYSSPLNAVFTRTVADPDVGVKFTGRTGDNTIARTTRSRTCCSRGRSARGPLRSTKRTTRSSAGTHVDSAGRRRSGRS
jgi:hypothetical protein